MLAELRIGDVERAGFEVWGTEEDALRHEGDVATRLGLAGIPGARAWARDDDDRRVDVEPEQLPMALVNRYLEIKRSGRL